MHFRWLFLIIVTVTTVLAADKPFRDAKSQESFWQIYTNALREDKVAQYQLGVMYERGIGVDRNETQASMWYEKSAWQGYMDSQYNLALMYASGRGVDKNLDRAMIWLAKAAKQGDREARKLLLEIIDGRLDDRPASAAKTALEAEATFETIVPVAIVAKEGAEVCTDAGVCTPYKPKTVFTSKSKKNGYYKISGIVTKKGWEPYSAEGWIAEEKVEIRK